MKPEISVEEERKSMEEVIEPLIKSLDRVHVDIKEAADVSGGIIQEFEEHSHDLVIIGASHEWGIRNVLFGTIPDVIADHAPCSVLMVRRFLPDHWSVKASEGVKKIKEMLGLSSSPDVMTG